MPIQFRLYDNTLVGASASVLSIFGTDQSILLIGSIRYPLQFQWNFTLSALMNSMNSSYIKVCESTSLKYYNE